MRHKGTFCSIVVFIASILVSCGKVKNSEYSNLDYSVYFSNTYENYAQGNTKIDEYEKHMLEHYLDSKSCIYFPFLYFSLQFDASIPEKGYSAADFIPEKYVGFLTSADGFTKLENGTIPSRLDVQLDEEDYSRTWYAFHFNCAFFIKDLLDTLEDAKNRNHIYSAYGGHSSPGGSYQVVSPLPITDDSEPLEESLIYSDAVKVFDKDHHFLDGCYNEFSICVARQVSGGEPLAFKDLLPSFSRNSDASFSTINDLKTIKELNNKLPSNIPNANRDWYKVIFPFKMEAQYALQLYKELQLVEGTFYAISPLCFDESLEIKVPVFSILVPCLNII